MLAICQKAWGLSDSIIFKKTCYFTIFNSQNHQNNKPNKNNKINLINHYFKVNFVSEKQII